MEYKVVLVVLFALASWSLVEGCVENATRQGNSCVCNEGFVGDGRFFCYNASEECCCWVKNDPGIKNLAGDTVIFHPAASTKLLDFSTARLAKGAGKVEVVVSAWTTRREGKIYYKGVEIILKQTTKKGDFFSDIIQVTACGEVSGLHTWEVTSKESGDDTFNIEATVTSNDDIGDSEIILDKSGCEIHLRIGEANFYHVDVTCALMRFGIRAYVPDEEEEIYVPGIFFALDKHCERTYNPSGGKLGLCLDPDQSFEAIEKATNITDPRQAVTYYSLLNKGTTDYPNAPSSLATLQNKLWQCSLTQLADLSNNTFWSLSEPQFINCISSDSEYQDYLVNFLIDLVEYYCQDDTGSCKDARDDIGDFCSDYLTENPVVKAWYDGIDCDYCYYYYYCDYYYYYSYYYYCYYYYYYDYPYYYYKK